MRTLIIDNYDSFTYILGDLVAQVNGEVPEIIKNDYCSWRDLDEKDFDNIIVSPGPGSPLVEKDLGLSADAVRFARVPLLGVCLGHQAIGTLAGGAVARGPRPVHGETSQVLHRGEGLFEGIPMSFEVCRYHSLILQWPLPPHLTMTAWTSGGLVMGIAHRERPQWGVQFHPESIISEFGHRLIENFRGLTERAHHSNRASERVSRDKPSMKAARSQRRRSFWRDMPATDGEELYRAIYADAPAAFWLDSSSADAGHGQWSFLGDPSGPEDYTLRYFTAQNRLERTDAHGTVILTESIFDALDRDIGPSPEDPPPCPFVGGFVGSFGYELRQECGSAIQRETLEPSALFIRSHRFIAINHVDRRMIIVAVDDPDEAERANLWLDAMSARLADLPREVLEPEVPHNSGEPLKFRLNISKSGYLEQVRAALELIAAGETYQVCLTNEITCEADLDPLTLYSILRNINPAPFAAFLQVGEHSLLSASPERFLRVDNGGIVETKPIKGTIRRDADPAKDQALANSLQASIKDRAENVMIVDLLRNDLAKVCETGSIQVPILFGIESFATVHQLVSTVRGRLKAGTSVVDIIRATFPGGSMTGAPKIRTMEFIDGFEQRARGFYSGSLGWLGDDGAADLNIIIRTISMAGGQLTLGAGGGIVARSDPDSEYEEMLLKAKASIAAIVSAAGREPDDFVIEGAGDEGAWAATAPQSKGQIAWTGHEDRHILDSCPSPASMPWLDEAWFCARGIDDRPFNAADAILQRADDGVRAGRAALLTEDDRWTYADLDAHVCRMTACLRQVLDIRAGNGVLLQLDNTPWMVAVFLAVLKAGGVAILCSPLLTVEEVEEIARDTRARIWIGTGADPLSGSHGATYLAIEELVAAAANLPTDPGRKASRTAPTDPAVILFSSGSSGKPKACIHYHRELIVVSETYGREIVPIGVDDVALASASSSFAYGLECSILMPLYHGAASIMLKERGPLDILRAIETHRVTHLYAIPAILRAMAGLAPRFSLKTLKNVISAGENCNSELIALWRGVSGLSIMDGLGSSEFNCFILSARAGEGRDGASGRVVPGYQARVLGDDDAEVATGEIGRLAVRGPTGCKYFGNTTEQETHIASGWTLTGDMVARDGDGVYWHHGRADAIINRGGIKIAAAEIEAVIQAHPAVAECAIVGIFEPKYQTSLIKAFLSLHEVAAEHEAIPSLRLWLRDRLPAHKIPDAIAVVERLPRNRNGKIMRFRLQEHQNV